MGVSRFSVVTGYHECFKQYLVYIYLVYIYIYYFGIYIYLA